MKRSMMMLMVAASFVLLSSYADAEVHPYANLDWVYKYVYTNGFEAATKKTHVRSAWQGEFGLFTDNGFDASVWYSLPASFKKVGDDPTTEVDICLGYSYGSFRIGAGYFFMFPDGKDVFYANDTLQVNAQFVKMLTHGKWSITPGIRVEYNFPVNGKHAKDTTGLYIFPSVSAAYAFDEHWGISAYTKFCADLGGYGADTALIGRFGLKGTYKLNKNFSAYVGLDMSEPLAQSAKDPRREHWIPKAGIITSF